MQANEFVDLYEFFRDYKSEMSLLDEDYQGYKNYLDYLKHTNPEKYKARVAATVAKNKEKAQAKFNALDDETKESKIASRLKTLFSKILKKHGIIDPTYYYDEKKQLSGSSVDELADKHPEAMQEILDIIQGSGINPDRGVEILYQLFGARADRVKANALYSKQRHENREPDDPLTQEIKRSNKESAKQQREAIIDELKAETNMEEFSRKLYDMILSHDLKKTKPLLAELKNQLSEDDPKQRFLDIALNKNLKIKHRGNNLEDF